MDGGVPNNIDNGAEVRSHVQKISTRQWVENNHYDAEKLFQKVNNSFSHVLYNRVSFSPTEFHFLYSFMFYLVQLFENDIEYLLSMEKLWQKRRPPTPLKLSSLSDSTDQGRQKQYSLSPPSLLVS